ncbi:membrane-bound lytic murein transglycosylase A [Janthinobacterium sp. CG_23.3]|uniref:murein transglycosylase A n=1 Tax=unclassified Janthinobacterium TaxID=2610881 RepID=UPI0006890CA4|nr:MULTISPECIES: murein transglycosylase A [unclassified Janthinobacterium]MEC5159276.1 membrane-bound lytic murein transglycosylase A [Janthinobacterium sp. CG_S6]
MSFSRSSLLVSMGAVALSLAACTSTPVPPAPVHIPAPIVKPEPAKPAAAPAVASAAPAPQFVPVGFAALPGWSRDDMRAAWPAFMASCGVLVKRADWKEACTIARQVNAGEERAIRLFFETFFVPHQVLAADGANSGLVTGYYEPLLHGARKRGGPYQTPLYKVPEDMVSVDLASVYPELKGMRLRGRLVGKKVLPYATRAEIERATEVTGKELMWVEDPVEAFFLQVQGSGRVQLADAQETVRVAYADQNGHPYKSIGKYLVEKGELTADQASAQGIKAWIAGHPTRQQELFNANPSYVFFKEERLPDPKVGPKGAFGVPLTPQRSVAVDATFLPLGAPLFLSTTQANSDIPMQRLVMAQDTGGAIRGAIRVDYFFGFGAEAAENAGRMKQSGMVWVLLPKQAPKR